MAERITSSLCGSYAYGSEGRTSPSPNARSSSSCSESSCSYGSCTLRKPVSRVHAFFFYLLSEFKVQSSRFNVRPFHSSLFTLHSSLSSSPPAVPGRPLPAGQTGRHLTEDLCDYLITVETVPAPTVRPPSRIAKRIFSSRATGAMSFTVISTLSPGITISTPSGSWMSPVTSVVRM